MKATCNPIFRKWFILFMLLFFSNLLIAQVKIKERVELKSTKDARSKINSEISGITLPQLNMQDFALSSGGGFKNTYNNTYDDAIFVPRIGGTMGLSLFQNLGSASDAWRWDYLLVFGPDGTIRNQYFIHDLDSCNYGPICFWDPVWATPEPYCFAYSEHPDCCFVNPWIFSPWIPYLNDSLCYPPYKMFFPVKAWEPLRFRLYTHDSILVKPNFHSQLGGQWGWLTTTDYPYVFSEYMIGSINTSEWYNSGIVVLRSAEYDTISGMNWATHFGMKWFAIDSSAVSGSLPPVDPSDPMVLMGGVKYRITLTHAKPNIIGPITYTDTAAHDLFTDLQDSVGKSVVVGPYSGSRTLQFSLNGKSGDISQWNIGNWYVGFENWTDYDFGDATLHVESISPTHLELWSTDATVYYGDTVVVDVVPCDYDSLFAPLGPNNWYEFSIALSGETANYGELIYNGAGSDSVEHIPSVNYRGVGAKFAANGLEPDSTVDLVFALKAFKIGGYGWPSSPDTLPVHAADTIIQELKFTINPINGKKFKILQSRSVNRPHGPSEITNRYSMPGKSMPAEKEKNTISLEKQSRLEFAMKEYSGSRIGHPITKVSNDGLDLSTDLTQRSFMQKSVIDPERGDANASDPILANNWGLGMDVPIKIMLGETKYFYATSAGGKLTIHETTSPVRPAGAITTDIWGDNPVSVVITDPDTSGRKMGVYWEKGKPIPNSTGNLPDGMIRLIGRYWHKDSVYTVKLMTNNPPAVLSIEVKKPSKLGNIDNSVVKDVFNNDFYLDTLIIKYSGENGIPPQLIKGQMKQESNFKPVWRYESERDLDYQTRFKNRFFADSLPFVKTTGHPKGTGDWPYDIQPSHSTNVSPEAYPSSDPPKTIGGYLAENWDKYKKKGKLGEPDSILYCADLSQRFKELYKPPTKLNRTEDSKAKQSAYTELSNELLDGETPLAKKYDIIAQTRIVTSYGFTQLMYTMTIDYGGTFNAETENKYAPTGTQYMNKSDPHQYPEKLNEQNTFMPIYCDRMLRNLHVLLNGNIPNSQWHGTRKTKTFEGFEANWKGSMYYYNPPKEYADSVMRKSQDYLPK